MGYLHIENLYKAPEILEVFALEKIHGTSAHVAFRAHQLSFFSGGEAHDRFAGLFDREVLGGSLREKFSADQTVVIYGEAFGGKQQGMSATYGQQLRFLPFDVQVDEVWLDVLSAVGLCESLGIGFVPFERGPLRLDWLDEQRDRDSLVAVVPGKPREGIVIRPIRELIRKNGGRFIYKHKRAEFRETATPREVDPAKAMVLAEASAIAEEWVTPRRLTHVLQKTPFRSDSDTGAVIRAMQEDVRREAGDEVVWSRDAEKAIGKATVALLHPKDVRMAIAGEAKVAG